MYHFSNELCMKVQPPHQPKIAKSRIYIYYSCSLEHECPPSEDEGQVDEAEEEEKINSPIRVSPDRVRSKSKEVSSNKSLDGKLSVKERLYVSRQTIGSCGIMVIISMVHVVLC